ncbi:hypothetical protein JT358_11635 [Micrococcales bacterium 31B]|nr:hypothetical protein [Micrococcales bacterium 31B]
MTDTERIDKALAELPEIWHGLLGAARRPTSRRGPAGHTPPGPRTPLSIVMLDQADELHAAVAAWAMHVGHLIGATPPLERVRFASGLPVGGIDPRALCNWLSSALPEVDASTLHDMAADLCSLLARGRSSLGLTQVSPETRERARARVDEIMRVRTELPGGGR